MQSREICNKGCFIRQQFCLFESDFFPASCKSLKNPLEYSIEKKLLFSFAVHVHKYYC